MNYLFLSTVSLLEPWAYEAISHHFKRDAKVLIYDIGNDTYADAFDYYDEVDNLNRIKRELAQMGISQIKTFHHYEDEMELEEKAIWADIIIFPPLAKVEVEHLKEDSLLYEILSLSNALILCIGQSGHICFHDAYGLQDFHIFPEFIYEYEPLNQAIQTIEQNGQPIVILEHDGGLLLEEEAMELLGSAKVYTMDDLDMLYTLKNSSF